MSNKKGMNIKEILLSTAALTIISGVVTAALAGTNALTKDTIAAINEKNETAARRQVIDADTFEKRTLTENGREVGYYAANKDGELVGYVFTVTSTGKSSGLVVMTGISRDGGITGVKITGDNETAGYVEKVTKAGLLRRFPGKKAEKEFRLGLDIDGVSQATKTSKGVTDGVNKAVSYFNKYAKEGQS